ncbi:PEP-utilizing enzyme [Nanoarchaeota archaeon]
MKELVNIFSREKSLLYFCVWDAGDRRGIELIGEKIKNNLFIIPPKGEKGSVWYEKEEMSVLKRKFLNSLKDHENNKMWDTIKTLMESSWEFLEPYAKGSKVIENIEEFNLYYDHLVDLWTCLNSFIYETLDYPEVDETIKKELSNFRDKIEQYTEKMSLNLTDYAKKQPLLEDVAYFITKDEVESKINPEDIKKRRNGCFMLNKNVYPLNQLKTILENEDLSFENIDTSKNEFTGTVVYKGNAKGKVRIVNGFKDLSKIKGGNIFVTEMTNPNYTVALKKSAAIITDEGGSLCHAAITSRELQKPCIVGTKIATQVLKDGDLVEVDADNGVVRIISSS